MKVNYNHENKKLIIEHELSDEHIRTLFHCKASEDGVIEFKNRLPSIKTDFKGNKISWQICDELVDMGLLTEIEEAYNVEFELTDLGEELLGKF